MWDQINDLMSQASSRIVAGIANFLPGLLALLLILLITVTLVGVLRLALKRFLRSIDFDNRIVQWGFPELAEWSPRRSPGDLLIVVVSWSILILGFLAGLSALDAAMPALLVVR